MIGSRGGGRMANVFASERARGKSTAVGRRDSRFPSMAIDLFAF